MIQAFRLCKTKHVGRALSGEGARIAGGRWNSQGLAMVYTSSSLSLATLEILVQLEDPEIFARYFSWIALQIPENAIEAVDAATLPPDWNAGEIGIHSRSVGDSWLRSMRSLCLAVPSVVTPGELNYLINPAHHRFSEIKVNEARPFRPDRRLF